uniref:Uncharacterized protein n=1 Tax=Anguilla anguilla TaxID=7936 RepID=A0A0E9XR36_ANGAN
MLKGVNLGNYTLRALKLSYARCILNNQQSMGL